MLPADCAGLGPPWLLLGFGSMAAPAHVQIQSQEIICDQTLHHQTGRGGLRGHGWWAGAAWDGEVVSGKSESGAGWRDEKCRREGAMG